MDTNSLSLLKNFSSADFSSSTILVNGFQEIPLPLISDKNDPDLKIDEEKLKQVAEVIDAFYFYDVRKVNKIKKNNNNIISYEFKDDLILELKFIEKSKDSKESWIEISAQSNNPKTINEAQDLNKKTKGYQFLNLDYFLKIVFYLLIQFQK